LSSLLGAESQQLGQHSVPCLGQTTGRRGRPVAVGRRRHRAAAATLMVVVALAPRDLKTQERLGTGSSNLVEMLIT